MNFELLAVQSSSVDSIDAVASRHSFSSNHTFNSIVLDTQWLPTIFQLSASGSAHEGVGFATLLSAFRQERILWFVK